MSRGEDDLAAGELVHADVHALRRAVYEIVYASFEEGEMTDDAFHRVMEEYAEGQVSSAAVKRLSYGAIERGITLDAIIEKYTDRSIQRLEPEVRTLLLMAFYEILYADSIPVYATANEIVELVGFAKGRKIIKKSITNKKRKDYVNAVIRSLIKDVQAGSDVTSGLKDYELLSLPPKLWKLLTDSYGKKTAKKIGGAFLSRKGEICLHIDTARISIDEYIDRLNSKKKNKKTKSIINKSDDETEENAEEQGINVVKGRYMKDAIILTGCEDVRALPGYDEGLFYIQDESSMLPVTVSGTKSGDTVVDVCGSPGGKTVHAMMRLAGQGEISVRDVSERKLERIRENIARFPYKNVSVKLFDGTETDEEWRERADVLLLDVPCSGIGIIGRKPDLRYSAMNVAVDIQSLQRDIVRASLPMLKKGGVLIYSTCTISLKENDENAEWIEHELGLMPESLDEYLPESLRSRQTAAGRLQVLPGIHQMDGFFVARFRKPD